MRYLSSFALLLSALTASGQLLDIKLPGFELRLPTVGGLLQTIDKIPLVHNTVDFVAERNMLRLLEIFRGMMPTGIAFLDLPPLDPYQRDHFDLSINNEMGQLNGTFDDLEIINLSTFVVDNLEYAWLLQEIVLNVSVPHLVIEGLYNISVNASLLKIHGDGPFRVDVFDATANLSTKLVFRDGAVEATNLDIDIAIKTLKCDFENLMGGGERGKTFNKLFGSLGPQVFQEFWPILKPRVTNEVLIIVNKVLAHIGPRTIIEHLRPNIDFRTNFSLG